MDAHFKFHAAAALRSALTRAKAIKEKDAVAFAVRAAGGHAMDVEVVDDVEVGLMTRARHVIHHIQYVQNVQYIVLFFLFSFTLIEPQGTHMVSINQSPQYIQYTLIYSLSSFADDETIFCRTKERKFGVDTTIFLIYIH